MKKTVLTPLTCAGFALSLLSTSNGQVLFSDNFDAGTSGTTWTAVNSLADASANFAFDYSTLGIPAAPRSGGTTIGVRFLANQTAGVQQGVSASPTGQSFTGDFRLQFDAWLNFNGPLDAGGSGSTQVGSFGWGTSGASAQWAGASSSVMFGATGDGGSTFDYRVYANNALQAPSSGMYAAGTGTSPDARNNTHPFYTALFGGQTAPAAQLALYAGQTNATSAGAFGFEWHDVVIEKLGQTMTWSVDGTVLATVPLEGVTLSGNNIFLGQFDINATSSIDPNDFLITSIYDNILVTQIPEPSTAVLSLFGLAALLFRRRRV